MFNIIAVGTDVNKGNDELVGKTYTLEEAMRVARNAGVGEGYNIEIRNWNELAFAK